MCGLGQVGLQEKAERIGAWNRFGAAVRVGAWGLPPRLAGF